MTHPIRLILILTLILTFARELAAQATPRVEETTTTTTAATDTAATAPSDDDEATGTDTTGTAEKKDPAGDVSSYQLRNWFRGTLQRYPPELTTILVLDPTLLSNDAFLAGYPDLAEFVAKHPEIRANPRFYLAEFRLPGDASRVLDDILEALAISGTFIGIALALAWMIRQIIEQRRWNRLSRTQTEVHNKILDRFGSSTEVLEYIKTPAGAKFLEAAPIALEAPRAPQNAPGNRIVLTVQIGVIAAILGIGLLLLSTRFATESAHGLFALGVIAFCIGAGFIASAAVSLFLSRRLGIWEPSHRDTPRPGGYGGYDDPGIVK